MFEGNLLARGAFVALADDTVGQPLFTEIGGGRPPVQRYVVMRFIDNNTYHFDVYASKEDAIGGDPSKALIDLEYKRVSEPPQAMGK